MTLRGAQRWDLAAFVLVLPLLLTSSLLLSFFFSRSRRARIFSALDFGAIVYFCRSRSTAVSVARFGGVWLSGVVSIVLEMMPKA